MKRLRELVLAGLPAVLLSCTFVEEVSEVKLSESSVILTVGEVKPISATVEPQGALY